MDADVASPVQPATEYSDAQHRFFDAIFHGDVPECERLLAEASATGLNPDGFSPLAFAAICDKIGVVEYLIDTARVPVDFIAPGSANGQTALHHAARGGNVRLVQFLLSRGANMNATDSAGQSTLHLACTGGHAFVVHYLLNQPSLIIDLQNRSGHTSLMVAIFRKHKECVNLLLRAGCDTTLEDKDGMNALHWAALAGDKGLVETVLGQLPVEHAKKKIQVQGQTFDVIGLANKKHHTEVETYLKKNIDFKTPNFWLKWVLKNVPREIRGNNKIRFAVFYSMFPVMCTMAANVFWIPGVLFMFLYGLSGFVWSEAPNNEPGHKPDKNSFMYGVYLGAVSMAAITELMMWSSGDVSVNQHAFFWSTGIVMLFLSYKTTFTNPGFIEPNPDIHQFMNEVMDQPDLKPEAVCFSCQIIRPIRSKHCPRCRKCVQCFDHHCPFTFNCIGAQNHMWFLALAVTNLWCMGFWSYLAYGWYNTHCAELGWIDSVFLSPVITGMFAWHVISYAWITPLTLWHIFMVITNLTTNEAVNKKKYKYLRDADGGYFNPFNRGLLGNFLAFCQGTRAVMANAQVDAYRTKSI